MLLLLRCNNVIITATVLLLILQLSTAKINAVSVFRRDEVDLHKYSAVLAAIEPFRLRLNEEIRKSLNPISYAFHKIKGTNLEDPTNEIRNGNIEVDVAYARYEEKINDIVRLYDLNPQVFNKMSIKLSSEPSLKKKVLLQAYYYKAAADLESHIKPALPFLPLGSKSLVNSGSTDQSDDTELFKTQSYKDKNSEFSRFCKALRTIERERIKLRERLQNELGISALPERMCDPDVRPVMCKQVQAACSVFPTIVNKVVDYYDLPTTKFEELYEKHSSNAIFRFRVHREIEKIEKLKRKA